MPETRHPVYNQSESPPIGGRSLSLQRLEIEASGHAGFCGFGISGFSFGAVRCLGWESIRKAQSALKRSPYC